MAAAGRGLLNIKPFIKKYAFKETHVCSFFPTDPVCAWTHTLKRLNCTSSDLTDDSGKDCSQLGRSDCWFGDLGGLGVQSHAALQLDPSGNIACFKARRSHVGNQTYLLRKRKKHCEGFFKQERELIWSSFKHLTVGLDGVWTLNTYCLKSARPHTPFVNWQFLSLHLKHYPSIQYLYHFFLSESREAIPSDTGTPWINCQPITRLTWRGEQSLTLG